MGGPVWASRTRYVAAALAALTAAGYFLIAAHVLPVVEKMDRGITVFGLIAGGGFVVLALMLLFVRRRWVWIAGALLMVFTIAMYFVVGRDRTPHYEIWGLLLRIPQVLILSSLACLAAGSRKAKASTDETPRE